MVQKKKDQDVLIVKDEKTGEIGVVAGLNKDGTPKVTGATPDNQADFLKFDRHGDVLDNFFTNFSASARTPTASVSIVWLPMVWRMFSMCSKQCSRTRLHTRNCLPPTR